MSSENLLQTVKLAIQDVVAPEVRELKAEMKALGHRMGGLESRMDSLERRISDQFQEAGARADAQFQAILAAIGRSTAENELMVYKQISQLAQRVAALEAMRPPAQ